MHYSYKTKDTCSVRIDFDMEDNIVTNVVFEKGCKGNLKAIGRLIDGWTADQIIEKCEGNMCGVRGTSCVDQLATALKKVKAEAN